MKLPTWRLRRRRSSPQAQRFIAYRLRNIELRYPPDAAAGGAALFVHLDDEGRETGEPVAVVLQAPDVEAIALGNLLTELARLIERDLDVYPEDVVAVVLAAPILPPREPVSTPPVGPGTTPPGASGPGGGGVLAGLA